MKILISPAKKLNFEIEEELPLSIPKFFSKTKILQAELKKLSAEALGELMKLSKNLSDLNWKRNQDWDEVDVAKKAALYAFNGEVYTGIDAKSLSKKSLHYFEDNLMILSGLYGFLKPLDELRPYRLEMGTKFGVGTKNLYEFWKETLTEELKSKLKEEEFILNLASKEYAKALDLKAFENRVVSCEFKDFKNGKLKTIMMYAKKARGQMARYVADHQIENIEDLKHFDLEGYKYDMELSSSLNLVFTR